MSPIKALLWREWRLAVGVGGGAFTALIFFFALVMIVPFGVGPRPETLKLIAPAMIWIGALLATLLGLDRLFQADIEDGTFDQLQLCAVPMGLIIWIKIFAHWSLCIVALIALSPLVGVMMGLSWSVCVWLMLSLLCGTPALTAMGAMGACLIVSLKRGGVLIPILVLPFTIPVLIFGVSVVEAASNVVQTPLVPLLVLLALSLLSLAIAPIVIGLGLRLVQS